MLVATPLKTPRLTLEPLEVADIAAIFAIAKEKKSIEDFQHVAPRLFTKTATWGNGLTAGCRSAEQFAAVAAIATVNPAPFFACPPATIDDYCAVDERNKGSISRLR